MWTSLEPLPHAPPNGHHHEDSREDSHAEKKEKATSLRNALIYTMAPTAGSPVSGFFCFPSSPGSHRPVSHRLSNRTGPVLHTRHAARSGHEKSEMRSGIPQPHVPGVRNHRSFSFGAFIGAASVSCAHRSTLQLSKTSRKISPHPNVVDSERAAPGQKNWQSLASGAVF